MAEERTLATARATDTPDDDDVTKAELQRRMEQARETITQTVTEIKDTVTNQYQSVKESISETLDWREQFRKRPVAWSVGALSVGFVTGYCIAASVKGEGRSGRREGYPSYEESDVWNVGAPLASGYSAGPSKTAASPASRAYASQAITGGAHGSTEYDEQALAGHGEFSLATGSTQSAATEEEQPSKPGLMERFKETKAFDRLQDEVSKLGDRFIDQLSTVGQEVVLPALFGKIKELFGVDLADQQKNQGGREVGNRGTQTASAAAAGASSASSSLADASRGTQTPSVGDTGGSSYGTSENRAYGSSSSSDASRDDYGRSSSSTNTKLSPGPQ